MKSNWPTKKLGEVCEKVSLIKAPLNSWPYIEIGDIDLESKTIIFKEKKSIKGAVIAPEDSVLVSRVRPTRGAIVFIDKNYVVSSAFTILKANKTETSSKFLFYWLSDSKSFLNYLQRKQKGSNYPSVRERDIFEFKIPLPPLEIQKQIVERLDKIAEAQKLNDELIQKSDELFQSLLHKELNPTGKYWEIKKLGEITEIIMGQSPPSSTYNTKSKGLPFFQGKFEFGETYPTPTKYCFSPIRIAESSDILISVRAPVGNVNLAKDKSCIGRGLAAIRVRKDINQIFLYFFLKMNENNWAKLSVGSTFSAIRRTNLENLKIPLPPIETQRKIIEKLSAVQDYKKKLLEQKSKLKELFESVLNKSMRGELIK